ncbi:Pyrophosphatase ppaX [Kingella potus]|uniref:Pyrophosphatase ppaX n=1 Tax=Kingella potus TaxID=265175 RepID=A0A377QYK5_9NEIS|nr:HAD hydrolase-like protein [Kingella potus]UOP00788.1 HAD hydrolase-like protein [Kingella potus]STR00426.1 Pyrophosphatase ppaX [Kingella potus]
MQPKLIIFDWDGTLADTAAPLIDTLRETFYECGLPKPEPERIRNLAGYSLVRIVRTLAPHAGEHKQEEIIEVYAAASLHPRHCGTQLFPDALPVLDTLQAQGFELAVATGKSRSGLERAIGESGTAAYWAATATATECHAKPAPDMVYKICGELCLAPSESLIAGDTVHDLEMAAHAGARGIGIATGAHSPDTLRKAPNIGILPALSALPAFLHTL